MPKYTQTFASLASQFKTQDDGVNFTITVDADNRKQAARRLAILLYGRCAVASSELTTVRPRCAKKKNRRIVCTCRGGNSGCAMHGHSDR
jgi:hypothetical protein